MKIYFFLSATGWWAKFLLIIEELKILEKKFKPTGIIMVPGLESEIFSRNNNYKNLFDVHHILIDKFLNTSVSKSEINHYQNEYGNLWKYVYAERRYLLFMFNKRFQTKIYTHDELIRLIIGKFKYFESVISKVDVVVTTPPASSWAYIMTSVAQKKGKKVINIDQVGFPRHKGMLTESNKQIWTSVEKKYLDKNFKIKKDVSKKAVELIERWRVESKNPPWLKITDTQKYLNKYLNFKKIKRYMVQLIKFWKGETSYIGSPLLILKHFIFFRLRDIFVRHVFKYDSIQDNEDYFYYPLHVEPESSLMINGVRGLNQISLIQKIAMQIPFDMKLYVKEHPTMVGWRFIKDYKLLKKIPNLKLINPNINGKKLLQNSKAIFTVSGTSGWEALMLKKPVLLVGTSFYRKLPMVKYIKNLDDISDELEWLNTKYCHSESDLVRFSSCIMSDAVDLPFEYFWGISDDQEVFKKLKKLNYVTETLAKRLHSIAKRKLNE